MRELPRVPLVQLPTPIHRLDRMSGDLGIELWIKRDDLTGFALGGNKGRKLEYLMADAISKGAQMMVSCGSSQSNFIRQLGAACSVLGLRCSAALMDLPYEDARPEGIPLERESGNVRLNRALGVEMHFMPDGTWDELYSAAEELALEHERAGLKVYRVPVGGSSPLGAYGFAAAVYELAGQAGPFDAVVVASSSGSTQVGLAAGLYDSPTKVIGIACDPEPGLTSDFAALSQGLSELADLPALGPKDFRLVLDYVGPGYGVPSVEGRAAATELARREGIFLDPI